MHIRIENVFKGSQICSEEKYEERGEYKNRRLRDENIMGREFLTKAFKTNKEYKGKEYSRVRRVGWVLNIKKICLSENIESVKICRTEIIMLKLHMIIIEIV